MKTLNFYPGDSDIMLTATKKGYNLSFAMYSTEIATSVTIVQNRYHNINTVVRNLRDKL